ncbi:HAD family hydrolase [Roseofilum casamattae]|uniref:HAD family hydrolase n=1 Tax=Roseofilum casamattae BLCC-M143 TaxID=3022442 RepID=A0ABT7BXV8_9CYAN|nr:HAD family hydrolase [Roseofilum casamattae]MDJ1183652.1 HAD family hydrolase [Roseofilum casamattae BLCC-M143]
MPIPDILALDFDGVLCDGLVEYFQTAWHAYSRLWNVENDRPPEGIAEQFYPLRPVIETGWEMPVLIRALVAGVSPSNILSHWREICQETIDRDRLSAPEIMAEVDGYRDRQIESNLDAWLACHRFYPGAIAQLKLLQNSSVKLVIITTKEARFARELLHQHGIEFPQEKIIGKGAKRPKTDSLLTFNPAENKIWFIEDRLKTLLSVAQHPELTSVKLFLATWGYNTVGDRESIAEHSRISALSLAQFCQPLAEWNHP